MTFLCTAGTQNNRLHKVTQDAMKSNCIQIVFILLFFV